MTTNFQNLEAALEQAIGAALKRKSKTNRGTFPPFRIPGATKTIVNGLLTAVQAESSALGQALGQSLAKQGLSLLSVLDAYVAALMTILEKNDHSPEDIERVQSYFSDLIQAFSIEEQAEIEKQHADIERAYSSTIAVQQKEQQQLLDKIRELSTPIIPVYQGILVLPLVGSLDTQRATEVTERLLEAIALQQAEIVIIDITGVSVVDTSTANHLLMTARAASLLGSYVVLVGISAEIAQTIIHIGIDLKALTTLANLQQGIAYALARLNLAIQPISA